MNNTIKKRLIIPFILLLGFMAANIKSIFNGVEANQPWRIVLASVSLVNTHQNGPCGWLRFKIIKHKKKRQAAAFFYLFLPD